MSSEQYESDEPEYLQALRERNARLERQMSFNDRRIVRLSKQALRRMIDGG